MQRRGFAKQRHRLSIIITYDMRLSLQHYAASGDTNMMVICVYSGTFDVLVIGGGSTGVGTALDAATRGLKYDRYTLSHTHARVCCCDPLLLTITNK